MNTIPLSKITLSDLPEAGGKNASSGEMYNKLAPLGIRVPDGFAITSTAFKNFLKENNIDDKLKKLLDGLNKKTFSNLPQIGKACKKLVLSATFLKNFQKTLLLLIILCRVMQKIIYR